MTPSSAGVSDSADAVVIGAGHNGLVAAAMLADAGWDVIVLEAQAEPGGAVKSAELIPGYISDLYSAFYPLSVASPALQALQLEDHGLRWTHAPAVVGHARSGADEDAAVIYREIDRTASELDRHTPGDGRRWCDLFLEWERIKEPLLQTLFAPFPPVRGPIGLLRRLGTADALRLAHLLLLPAGVMAERLFAGDAARLLLLGNAMHADVPIDAPASGVMGFLLIMLAQSGGFPVPVGGAGQLTAALVRRAEYAGARIECAQTVESIGVSGDRATDVRTTGGRSVRCRRAVIADTSAPQLYQQLLPAASLPARLRDGLDRFVWDTPVLKINYALDSPIPWRAKNLSDAGTVHLGGDHNGLIRWMADLNTRTLPEHPFVLFGQMTTADATRSAAGTESAWAYTHLPRGLADDHAAERLAERVDRVLEEHAPGFRGRIVGKVTQRPSDLEHSDANLHTGAVNGGTSQLFQQLVFRPAPGFGGATTPLQNVFLGSAGASPGGGVHGICGRNAARAALAAAGATGWPRRGINRAVTKLLSG
ncbi:NAD(P)/FAD-dependent oxidoreductase [Candidatus Mycobacterium wuenschmannii]|uniref:Pyridine nucleotide-disulfide oxidoreductase domain-containing protein 2 n=1 Tax=Candidatus Mycobacterium wuenschmannii TaxID=3027808 RepID=A0ABY8VWJ6_9MYCO|nr:NAD(P)/FAD-dependent oxidoreductase [Candidatus Mycobacterium wuenschmannii]WIM88005.1 NAD(P)/FAD-dependent oxidoreductase [Candidatus Mycobacterium wuenschmannii]